MPSFRAEQWAFKTYAIRADGRGEGFGVTTHCGGDQALVMEFGIDLRSRCLGSHTLCRMHTLYQPP